MNDLSNWASEKGEALHAKYNNKLTKAVSDAIDIVGAIVNESKAGIVAEGLLMAVNNMQGMRPLTDILHDMIGRVESNASVYDMIKTVRSMIQKMRQQFREEVPKVIDAQFKQKLTDQQWTSAHRSMARSDLASLVQGRSQEEVLNLLHDDTARAAEIKSLEAAIAQMDKGKSMVQFKPRQNSDIMIQKAKELARFMMTGETASNPLRNANAIARMLGEQLPDASRKIHPDLAKTLDQLASLYALDHQSESEKQLMAGLVGNEKDGMKFVLSYLQGQRKDEMEKAHSSDRALLNHFKGYVPEVQQAGQSLIVADDKEYAHLVGQSYVRLGDYAGSKAEPGKIKRGYYFLPVNGKMPYQQGIVQNARSTAGGVDVGSGYSQRLSAGRITDPDEVQRIAGIIASVGDRSAKEHLMPVFNHLGEVVAYERSLDQGLVDSKLKFNRQLHQMLGVWRGRQMEEELAGQYNTQLIGKVHDMYESDLAKSKSNASRYVNVFAKAELAKDPVLRDAVNLITPQAKRQIESQFGKGEFWVRRDMLNDVLGYRSASVGDAWTGNSRWTPATQNLMKNVAMSVFGNKAYQHMVNAERTWQNLISNAKTMIVIKSVVVPIQNIVANGYQLISRGVPVRSIAVGMPKKMQEVQAYVKSEVRRIEADAELRAAVGRNDSSARIKLEAEIQAINDSHKRLSIWPLIQAGEFSAVSDGQATAEEVELTSGNLNGYMEKLVDKLPPGFKTVGRYGLITRDTALFKGMQTAVEYGDFLAKAVLYDHLIKQGKTKAEALGRITEEYVNYDRLPGRFRGYTESMGLLWFYNYKVRMAKIALSTIRNNPVHALLAGALPTPPLLGNIGLPFSDNIFTQTLNGNLLRGVGMGSLIRAPQMDPWAHLLSL
jgi:hypothetical protein